MTRTQVLIVSPLEAGLAARLQAADPRAEVLYEPDLVPPARFPADHRGDPAFERDAEGEARWRALLDRAEVLLGVPGDSAEGLAEAVNGLPGLRWVHATSAGAGEQVRKAGLPPEALERVAITTSRGVHAKPLAEFAVLGLLAVAKELPRLAEQQRARDWPEVHTPLRELSGQTLFLVGLGEIGREVARLGKALGMRTVGFRRTEGPPLDDVDEVHGPQRL
ncbi:MAG TPA: NAD(P)-dependent oxidoreductase, partial [Actinomycetota bacterium]|nr:NAD(P)-dependent oxidoreductase [Actinomycetota bacterium]